MFHREIRQSLDTHDPRGGPGDQTLSPLYIFPLETSYQSVTSTHNTTTIFLEIHPKWVKWSKVLCCHAVTKFHQNLRDAETYCLALAHKISDHLEHCTWCYSANSIAGQNMANRIVHVNPSQFSRFIMTIHPAMSNQPTQAPSIQFILQHRLCRYNYQPQERTS